MSERCRLIVPHVQAKPDVAIIGAPSNVRGSIDDPECTMDLDLAEVSPCLGMFSIGIV